MDEQTHKLCDLNVKVEYVRDMTDEEVDRFAQMLFQWWVKDYERNEKESTGSTSRP